MRRPRVLVAASLALLALAGCPESGEAPDAAAAADAADDAAPCDFSDCPFSPLEEWRRPIEDYVAAAQEALGGTVGQLIDDLIVFEDRLYFGYGDANRNAGRVVDIQIRYFAGPEDPAPTVDLARTDEEEIALFRRFGDTLYVPGVDATEDAFLGNVLVRPAGGAWTKQRAVPGGVHVHDLAAFGDALYACGSGALDLDSWNTGMVHSYLWRSSDGGATWEIAAGVQNTEQGDRRWVRLVPFPAELLVFGYRSSGGTIAELLADSWDGEALSPSGIAPGHFVLDADLLDPTTAILRAVAVTSTLRFEAVRLVAGGAAEPIAALAGETVLDAHPIEPGKMVLVTLEGDAYPAPPETEGRRVRVLYTEDLETFTELVSTTTLVPLPSSVAVWRDAVYVGTDGGRIYRSRVER